MRRSYRTMASLPDRDIPCRRRRMGFPISGMHLRNLPSDSARRLELLAAFTFSNNCVLPHSILRQNEDTRLPSSNKIILNFQVNLTWLGAKGIMIAKIA